MIKILSLPYWYRAKVKILVVHKCTYIIVMVGIQ